MNTHTHFPAPLLLALLLVMLSTGCENKRDDSGSLGGMWQLTEWRAADGSIAYQKPDTTLYYKVRQNLLMLQELPGETDSYFLTRYHRTPDSLVIDRPYKIVNNAERDTVLHPIADLRRYGIPANGRLHIVILRSDRMLLSGEEGKLLFRKY